MGKFGIKLLMILLPAQLFAHPGLGAGELAELSLEELADIVITATRFPEDSLYAPSSTTKVTEADWRKRGARRTLDAISAVPGVYVSSSYQGTTIPNFRGFAGITSFKGYAMQLDGVPLNMYTLQTPAYAFPEVPLGNLSAIEVTRGPGSALYGTDSFYGTVAMQTWSSDEDVTEVDLSGGSFEYHSETARTSQAITDDWRLTMIASYQNLGDRSRDFRFTETGTGVVRNEKLEDSFYSQGYVAKVSSETIELAYHYLEHVGREIAGHPEVLSQQLTNGATSRLHASDQIYRARWNQPLSDELNLDLKGYYVRGTYQGNLMSGPGGPPADSSRLSDRHADQSAGGDVTLKKPFGDSRYQALLGYGFDWMDNRMFGSGFDGDTPALEGSGVDRDINSWFGQLELIPVEDFMRITLGGRYDYYSDFGGEFSPRAAVLFETSEHSVLKFMYGQAFRAPALLEQVGNPGVLLGGGHELVPEEIDTYEVAWVYRGDVARFGVTGFYNEVKDGIDIRLNTASAEPFAWTNVTESESIGAEIEAGLSMHGISFDANYTYAQAQVSEPVESSSAFRAFPKHMANLSVSFDPTERFTLTINNTNYFSMQSLETLSAVTYTNSGESLPSFWRTDIHASYQLPVYSYDTEFFLFLEDIFDRQDMAAQPTTMERGISGSGFAAIAGLRVALQ